MLEHYQAVLGEIEKFIVSEKLISLPERDAGIRIATAAETAAQPAPHLDVPRLIGNTGEYPFFVIPQIVQNEDGSWPQTDDTYEAGAWTLTAHEARPGHEMQFSSMIEAGVSTARGMRRRKEILATIKHCMGATHFVMKRLPNVQTEMSLHVLAYNLKRVINIFGVPN